MKITLSVRLSRSRVVSNNHVWYVSVERDDGKLNGNEINEWNKIKGNRNDNEDMEDRKKGTKSPRKLRIRDILILSHF